MIINLIGSLGAVLCVIMYFLLQCRKCSINNYPYSIISSIGSACLFASLMVNWNLGSVLIETFWLFISIFGIYQVWRFRNETSLSR